MTMDQSRWDEWRDSVLRNVTRRRAAALEALASNARQAGS